MGKQGELFFRAWDLGLSWPGWDKAEHRLTLRGQLPGAELQNSLPREATGAPELVVFNVKLPSGAGNSLGSALLHRQRTGLHGPTQPAPARSR